MFARVIRHPDIIRNIPTLETFLYKQLYPCRVPPLQKKSILIFHTCCQVTVCARMCFLDVQKKPFPYWADLEIRGVAATTDHVPLAYGSEQYSNLTLFDVSGSFA